MKENMLLQYSDDIVKVGLQSLRAEVLEIVEQSSRSCAAAVESSACRAGAHAEQKLQQSLEHLYDVVALYQVQHNTKLGQILDASREQVTKLDKVEQSCIQEWVKNFQTRDLEKEDRGQLQAIFAELMVLHKKLSFYTEATAEQNLPAGKYETIYSPKNYFLKGHYQAQ